MYRSFSLRPRVIFLERHQPGMPCISLCGVYIEDSSVLYLYLLYVCAERSGMEYCHAVRQKRNRGKDNRSGLKKQAGEKDLNAQIYARIRAWLLLLQE